MSKLSEASPSLLFLLNLIGILAFSWFASWTYLYSFTELWRHLSDTDFRNVLCMSIIISTLIVMDGAVLLGKIVVQRKGYEYAELERKRVPATRT